MSSNVVIGYSFKLLNLIQLCEHTTVWFPTLFSAAVNGLLYTHENLYHVHLAVGFLGLVYMGFSEMGWLLTRHVPSTSPCCLIAKWFRFVCPHDLSGPCGHLSFQPLVS